MFPVGLKLKYSFTGRTVKYIRYMDDILILAKTRWRLKKAVKEMNRIFESLRLEKHPDKTFVGRTAKGFDFLGYHFTLDFIYLAEKTIEKFSQHIHWLYEQGAPDKRIGKYVARWVGWVRKMYEILRSYLSCYIMVNNVPCATTTFFNSRCSSLQLLNIPLDL